MRTWPGWRLARARRSNGGTSGASASRRRSES
jgi:hypothetical protein